MKEELTREKLKELINEAYDDYLDKLDELAEDADIAPASPRQVQDNPATHAAAARAYAAFEQRQNELNAKYAAPRDAAALAREKAASDEQTRATQLAQAQENLQQAEDFQMQEYARIQAMRSAGIKVSADESAGISAAAQAKVDHWSQVVDDLQQAEGETS